MQNGRTAINHIRLELWQFYLQRMHKMAERKCIGRVIQTNAKTQFIAQCQFQSYWPPQQTHNILKYKQNNK